MTPLLFNLTLEKVIRKLHVDTCYAMREQKDEDRRENAECSEQIRILKFEDAINGLRWVEEGHPEGQGSK